MTTAFFVMGNMVFTSKSFPIEAMFVILLTHFIFWQLILAELELLVCCLPTLDDTVWTGEAYLGALLVYGDVYGFWLGEHGYIISQY
jgi:hypothetical protein